MLTMSTYFLMQLFGRDRSEPGLLYSYLDVVTTSSLLRILTFLTLECFPQIVTKWISNF